MLFEQCAGAPFALPIKNGRCGQLVLHDEQSNATTDVQPWAPEAAAGVLALPPRIFRMELRTRGVRRQVRAGVCEDSPFVDEFGRKSLLATAYNRFLLADVAPHVHSPFDPLGGLAMYVASLALPTTR